MDSGGTMLCASWQSAHTGASPPDSPNTRSPWNEPRYMSKTSAWQSRQAPILAVSSQPSVCSASCCPGLKPRWQLVQASLPCRDRS